MRNQTNQRSIILSNTTSGTRTQTPLLEADLKSAAPANYAKVAKKCPVRDLNPCYRLERAVSYTARLTGLIHLGSRGAAPLSILLLTKTQLSAVLCSFGLIPKRAHSFISSLILALPIYLSWKSRS